MQSDIAVCRRAAARETAQAGLGEGLRCGFADKHRPQQLLPFAVVGAGFSAAARIAPHTRSPVAACSGRIRCSIASTVMTAAATARRRRMPTGRDGGTVGAEEVLRDSEAV